MILQVLITNLMDGKTERMKWFILVTDLTIDIQSRRLIASLNMSAIMKAMKKWRLYLSSKIKTDQDQVLLDKNGELLQFLEFTRSKDQEDGVG